MTSQDQDAPTGAAPRIRRWAPPECNQFLRERWSGIAVQDIMIKTIALCLGESKEDDEVDGFEEAGRDPRCAPDLTESNRVFISKMRHPAAMNNQCCHCIRPLDATGVQPTFYSNSSDANLFTITLTLSQSLFKSMKTKPLTLPITSFSFSVTLSKIFFSNVPLYC